MEQMILEGNPEYGVELGNRIDFGKSSGKLAGLRGFTIEIPKRHESILREALSQKGPSVSQAVVRSNEPPDAGKGRRNRHCILLNRCLRGLRCDEILKTIRIGRSRDRFSAMANPSRRTAVRARKDLEMAANRIREGRFQRSPFSFLTAGPASSRGS